MRHGQLTRFPFLGIITLLRSIGSSSSRIVFLIGLVVDFTLISNAVHSQGLYNVPLVPNGALLECFPPSFNHI